MFAAKLALMTGEECKWPAKTSAGSRDAAFKFFFRIPESHCSIVMMKLLLVREVARSLTAKTLPSDT